ncbi:amidohydrolase family protein [Rhodohalobacter barkolensis]|uniref:Amidohydrolase n=1 Tax=Rhodohalobacter barkolensis TaxID=2053187 RepID=A0A2N0VI97_9BACT|nr:amidohydrolase family protein [Rhodohalobacter barkolensis]PKD43916.1 amidohydrolase [Rhodohalobacter barkolensis]
MKRLLLFALSFFFALGTYAQENGDDKWDVTQHRADFTEISFDTEEGTWMNLDVSPDGTEIVFDLLGNIYIIPIEGGEAKVLRENLAYEIQPRFSPDGSKISFTSDAGGGDNIWVMNRDGSDAKQITEESFRLLNNASWSPDGDYIVARKHFTSGRSLGAGELWLYHITGGSGIQLVERMNDQQDLGQPNVSPDGRYIYYSQDVYPGGGFQYNRDANSQIYVINRYDRETGEIDRITGGPGGAISPTVSPDGKQLAFVKRVRTKSVLYIRDLETGIEKPVYDELSFDQQQAWAIFGPYTNISWTPDGNHLVFWAMGKIHKLNTETLEAEEIPFSAEVNQQLADVVHFEFDPAPDTFQAKAVRHAVTSPDGETLVFNAAGYLWKKDLPNGTPERITEEENLEFEPSFSPDGNLLAYVTWTDEELGKIKTLRLDRRNARPQTITTEKGIYRTPSFSPDGQTLLFRRDSGNNHQGHAYTQNPGIYTMPVSGGEMKLISESGSNPKFNASGDRIFYQAYTSFRSMDLNGQDDRQHFQSEYAIDYTPSPDNKWIAFTELYKVYIAPMPQVGTDITLSSNTRSIPVTHVARDAGYNLHWSADSDELRWTLGEQFYSVGLNEAFEFLNGETNEELPLGDNDAISIGLEIESDKPSGTVAFTNAHIITMNGEEVIENGTIVVRENRIEAVGTADEISIPRGAYVMDVEGKTIMPGLVDAHAHIGNFRSGLSPNQQWEYFANLAYGVTTAHDPSSNTEMIFSQAEMVRSGNMIGPRIFSTGRILYGAENVQKTVINNLEDARSAIRRTQAFGATSVKSYNQPRREQRQQVLEAARELGVNVVPEGGSTFTHNMSMILDGHTGIEHNIPIAPLYNDVLTLWGESNVGYTPTLVVNYGGMNGEYYWYQHTNVWEKEHLLTFTPRGMVDSRSRHRTMVPEEEYEIGHMQVAAAAKELHDRGITVNIGAHGQLQGLAAHWETWMFTQGGMSNHDALKVATLNGANYIGMGDHIGSLEPGKLADLIVIDGNPLEDIYDTEFVEYTMINGRLYDSKTMNEFGNHERERLPFWWEQEGYSEQFDWHAITGGNSNGHGH